MSRDLTCSESRTRVTEFKNRIDVFVGQYRVIYGSNCLGRQTPFNREFKYDRKIQSASLLPLYSIFITTGSRQGVQQRKQNGGSRNPLSTCSNHQPKTVLLPE